MLAIFSRASRELSALPTNTPELPTGTIWLDLHQPTPDELRYVEQTLGIVLPTREEMREIEASARVYEEGEALFLTTTLLESADTPPPETTEITFILVNGRLVTLRYSEPQPFRSMRWRLERSGPGLNNGSAVLFWLIDAIVERLADILERGQQDMNALGREIFGAARMNRKDEERPDLLEAIERIGRAGDTASKVRDSLLTLQRVLFVLAATERLPPGTRKEARLRAKTANRDVSSLIDHAGYLSQKINLLLDATLGMINIEQNAIIKIFSVVAVVFLPPTLIASIYGMNFALMPELHWRLGYPFALFLMVLSAILPYLYFKRRRWL